jgi:hypothetical protein
VVVVVGGGDNENCFHKLWAQLIGDIVAAALQGLVAFHCVTQD